MKHSGTKKRSQFVFKSVFGLILFFYTMVLCSLFFYAIVNSLKDLFQFVDDPVGFPKQWKFSNYPFVFAQMSSKVSPTLTYYIEHMFFGSLLSTLLCTLAVTLATFLMAYASAQFPHKIMSKVIYVLVMICIIIPIIGSYPSEMRVIKTLNIYNNILGIFFLKFSFGNMYFLILYEAIKGIPKDYSEAAQMDGASKLRVMLQIMVPMIKNILGSIFLVQFINFWNDYTTILMYFPKFPNLSLGLIGFSFNTSGAVAATPIKLAACIICIIPIAALFAIFQKPLMDNVSAGGLKG